ncbi:tyrosine-type recombinase/integrase [Aeromonas caviae]|uniref:tyrosine-type recombinase/integrase n=1 Tax=Aeromonas caviae TaxID=648 RepID=UPI002B49A1BF|nr:integrase arm-type DNA-binding domain-containing protein [Aeromonas caviae]
MAIKPLTDSSVKTAKFDSDAPANNTRRDGQGLELRISKTAKSWLFKYYRPADGKRTNMSFGQYPDVSLAMARQKRQEARALLADGVDPAIDRKAKVEAERAANANTFAAITDRVMELKRVKQTAQHCKEVIARFDLHILPSLGKLPVADIRAPFVIAALKPLEKAGKLDTLKRCCQHVNEVMNFAVNSGLVEYNSCAKIATVFATNKVEHMATLPPEGITELIAAMDDAALKFTTRMLMEWQLHTLARPAEAAGARWDEIDEESQTWVIPADRMKMGREHRVPLTDATMAILDRLRPWSGNREYLFPHNSNPKAHAGPGTANCALKRMGFQDRQTAHGFRALGSTTLNEAGFNSDAIEAALAHVDGNKVRASYNRADYFAERMIMMRWWSAHIEKARRGEFSIELGRRGLELVV